MFADDFTDVDTTQLISHTPTGGTAWTLQVGLASEAVITANECEVIAGGSQSFHSCDDQGSADCYTEIVVREVTNYLFPACLRATKVNALNSSWIGIAIRLNKVEVWKQDAGTFAKLGLTGTTTVNFNDIVRLIANGLDISVTINGVAETSIGVITEAFNSTVTMQGIATRASGKIDGFKAGPLAAPLTGAASPTGAGTTIAAATVNDQGAASPTGAGTTIAAATVSDQGAASPAGAGTAIAAATVNDPGAASPTGAGTAIAAATVSDQGAASPTGAGTAIAAATVSDQGAASPTGAGTAAAAATVNDQGAASPTGAGSLIANGSGGAISKPSQAYLSAIQARNNPDQLIALMVIDHPDLSAVDWPPDGKIRITDAGVNLAANGNIYTAWPFRWRRPDQRADRLPQVPLAIDNVDPRIMQAILPLSEPPTVTISAVMESSPDIVEEGPMVFDLQRTQDNRTDITAMIGFEPMLWMKYGRLGFDPVRFPGLFR